MNIMNTNKILIIFYFIIEIFSLNFAYAINVKNDQTTSFQEPYLETKNFQIYIKDLCPLYATVCGDVTYIAINKQNRNNKITLKGTTLNDGYQYKFVGYIFVNGGYTYTLTSQNQNNLNNWILKVTQKMNNGNMHTLLQEDAKWQYNQNDFYETKSYIIYLLNECKESYVACDGLAFNILNKQNKRQIVVKGSTQNSQTNQDFQGYQFSSGIVDYTLADFNNLHTLYVNMKKNGDTIFSENILNLNE